VTWRVLWRGFLLCAALLIGAVVIYYGVIFDGQLPDHQALRGKNDLALHAAGFFVLSLPLLFVWPNRWMRVIAGLLAIAVAIEVVQFWQPGRNPGLDDVLASMAGVLMAGVLVGLMALSRRLIFGQDSEKE
jgi:VanZ family protein